MCGWPLIEAEVVDSPGTCSDDSCKPAMALKSSSREPASAPGSATSAAVWLTLPVQQHQLELTKISQRYTRS